MTTGEEHCNTLWMDRPKCVAIFFANVLSSPQKKKKKQLQQLLSAGQLEEIAGKTTEGSEGLQSGLLASRKKNHTSLPRQADRRDAATAASACSQFTARPIMVRAKAGFELVRKPSYLVGEPCHRWCRAAWTLVRRPLRSMAWCHRPAALPEAI